ncbi:uncharacterized protein C10orf67, mitochondrial-like isoform X2 [Pomacea canaliculata]|uniref:uncharacterized protein C10orf67, mitochondrial-like isoform X2 n=1 Tax=Pomacea canaliculata TaxID=400727 RepID=UPI000D73BBB3|nr:uncharacterized protein C10orf67, mitochondrial-like isoform X2 [Pomacea canaliculata]
MAARSTKMEMREYSVAEQELQDHILQIYGTRDNDDDMFRPALADAQKIGFFSLDRASQTEVTEIVDLKEMTEVLQILLQDVSSLRRDITFTKHVMQANHESKLQEKSLELYCRINERISELEKIHLDRVNTLRKAFRQQLADAVARLSVMYKKNLDANLHRERTRQASDLKGQGDRIQELKSTIAHNESIIRMLQLQLQQQQQAKEQERRLILDDLSSVKSRSGHNTPSPEMKKVESPRSDSRLNALQDEVEELREEAEQMERQVQRLSEALDIKEEENANLNKTLDDVRQELEKQQILVDQLKHENEEIRMEAEKDMQASKKHLMKQKLELEQANADLVRQAKEEALRQAKGEALKLQAEEQGRLKELMDQMKELEKQLSAERSKALERSTKGAAENDSLRLSEAQLKNEVKKLKEEIERIHRMWEKKFSVLQASMHALKDESYLRQTLQRQAAALHYASVSYAADVPAGDTQSNAGSLPKKPLPNIRHSGRSRGQADRDYISYTVSAQSGRKTEPLSVDENQVASDPEQDLPSDVPPLPEPPRRTPQDCGVQDSRPSTRSHIVVLPTGEV